MSSTLSGCVDRHVALDQRERDRAELVVAGARPDEADVAAVVGHRRAGGRQPVLRAVEVQQHQPAGRAAERVDAGDRLLAAVAALVEVHRRADPADLVGDGAVVGVEAEAGLAPLDPQRLEGPEAGGRAGSVGVRLEPVAGNEVVATCPASPGRHITARSSTSDTSTRVMNFIRSSHSTRAAPAPGSVCAVNASPSSTPGEGVLDVALRAQHERLRPGAGREAVEVLGGQVVQPGQPLRARDPQHVAVRQVHEPLALREGALLGVERAVVRGHRGVDAVAGDGPGQGEEGAGHGSSLGRRGWVARAGAVRALAEDREVADVDDEPVGGEGVDERLHQAGSYDRTLRQRRQTAWTCSCSTVEW